ncbi:MAG: nucleotidyltransferase family protein [Actinomycetota bacterium]|nr:nucleotidyltransferase family protein [Actinomycetota bacterium]MDH4353048.1 nucleotidyltransferase family protein [Actinomycetota bacterium]
MTVTAGLVLAAGAGRRFGGPKAPAVVDDERLVDRAVRVLRAGGCPQVVVVLGAWVGEVPDADIVVNDDWESGMASSLRAGLSELAGRTDVDRVLVTLVDLPGLTAAAVRRLAASADELAVATYHGDRGHPVLLGRGHWSAIADSATGDQGARHYLQSHQVSLVEVGDVASGLDLDQR